MLLLHLARKSLTNRLLTTSLTALSIAFSVALLVGVENVRTGMRESFSNTVSGTDLVVGSRGGTIQLMLYAVFGMGSPVANISHDTWKEWDEHPAVSWTIPYALGDSHRGFRVIGTNDSFYEHYKYRGGQPIALAEGRAAQSVFDVVLGAQVAERLGYVLGDRISVTHGMSAVGFMNHDEMPFEVVGVLDKTFTPVDRAIYVTLEGVTAIHMGWESGGPPMPGDEISAADVLAMEEVPVSQITSFFLGAESRAYTLQLQRDISTSEDEPLTAVIPGVALSEMWRGIGYAEDGLLVISGFVVLVGLLGMLVSIYTSLDARRREMAILRALGAGPRRIVSLLVLEAGALSIIGALLGVAFVYVGLAALQPWLEGQFGLQVPIQALDGMQLMYIGTVIALGFVAGLVPALKAYRTALHDGLSVRI
ncbi:MAG TPA: peptide ABC transporter permease [Gemmatimonadetes bacterium]|jgi:putative ABC transport system permease protein|nr:peptide ABC transporter permease [Gemmatimonadota bacterium]|tara:strand:- start:826 stop:2091 length:1266 start_codon:yes stop_codon:yes gene_type:complete